MPKTASLPVQQVLQFDAPPPQKPVPKGRPRSEKSRLSILKATNALLLQMSVQELSIEAIARKAKVGKTTIYRWWPNKAAVVMDALSSQPAAQGSLSAPKNNTQAVEMQLEKLIRLLQGRNGGTIAQLFSEAQGSGEARKAFESHFLSPLIDAIGFSFEQGQKLREFRKDLDAKTAVDILCGPIFFRLMAHPTDFKEKFQQTWPKEAIRLIAA